MGEEILEQIISFKDDYVVVDHDNQVIQKLTKRGIPSLFGDIEDEDLLIHGSYRTVADNDGFWEITNVYPNEVITPADSVYKITETFADDSSQAFYISIPDGATPNYWVGDLLVAEPDYVS